MPRTMKTQKSSPVHSKQPLTPDASDPFKLDEVIDNRFRIDFKIGEGSHGHVYQAFDFATNETVAIKTYKRERDHELPREVVWLEELQPLKMIPRLIFHSKYGEVQFTAMQLLGPNLCYLREVFFPLSLATVLSLSLKMLDRIFDLHNVGMIHGDIKPSNFAIGLPPDATRHVYLLDFSLTRKQDDPKNTKAGKKRVFGTLRFAGRPRHLAEDHTDLDDLYSFLYTLLDLRMKLPWRKERDKTRVYMMKEELTDELLVTSLHHNFLTFKEYIDNLNGSELNQKHLKGLITKAIKSSKIETCALYEWELEPEKVWEKKKRESISTASRSHNS